MKYHAPKTLFFWAIALLCCTTTAWTQTVIKMQIEGGVFTLPCKVNNLPLKFIFDTGSSDVSISLIEAAFMAKNGYLTNEDIRGTSIYTIANGEEVEGVKINLRKIQIGDVFLYNVEASIMNSLEAPLLLGQSAISRLGRIELDYNANTLKILKSNTVSAPTTKPSINSTIPALTNSKTQAIYAFIKAENERDINKIITHFASSVNRYYNTMNPTHTDLRNLYEASWRRSAYATNEIINIYPIDDYSYDVQVSFTFYLNSEQKEKTVNSKVRFVFDRWGKIVETYSVK
ncbi:MAG TPA: retropepsin-like aspartic protease [Chitinophagales bacterium]|nr:retropepsin-like aspartic protease [Chitinophagales bacterium]HRK26434.1 retropepsin-like aspartic protease [Chitinophagales bacterium]